MGEELRNKTAAQHAAENKEYRKLLIIYSKDTGNSVTRLSKIFNCSRRAMNRYMSGDRQVPMKIIDKVLSEYGIERSCRRKESLEEFNESGAFIWYGNGEILFNTLYLYRKNHLLVTRFEAACKLNIQEQVLLEYEHGLRKITHTDTVKILNCFSLTLPELFPSLISYDGGISYLPLRVIDTVEVAGENYNFFADDAPYVTSKDEPVNTWASFPVVRYGPEGEPGMNYTPSELTMDEYFNTCELFFEDTEEEKPNLDGKKLPPTYIHMQKVGQTKPKEWYSEYKNVYSKVEFLDDYKIKLRKLGYGASPSFDLKNYVFSDSAWYALLRDPEYFKQGRLTYIGETTPYNQSIVWPDNQYVRLVELFIDRNRTREKKYWFSAIEAGFVANGRYDQWVKYVWDGEPKICSPYDAN